MLVLSPGVKTYGGVFFLRLSSVLKFMLRMFPLFEKAAYNLMGVIFAL